MCKNYFFSQIIKIIIIIIIIIMIMIIIIINLSRATQVD